MVDGYHMVGLNKKQLRHFHSNHCGIQFCSHHKELPLMSQFFPYLFYSNDCQSYRRMDELLDTFRQLLNKGFNRRGGLNRKICLPGINSILHSSVHIFAEPCRAPLSMRICELSGFEFQHVGQYDLKIFNKLFTG